MKINGQLRVCDRCGKTKFYKCTGTKTLSGGFEQFNEFEIEEGWKGDHITGDLCPDCATAYEELRRNFANELKTQIEGGTDGARVDFNS